MKIISRIFLGIIIFCALFLLLNQAKIRAVVYSNRGTAHLNMEEYDQAIQNYDKAIELNPNLAIAYNNRGNAYEDKGEYDRAIQDYDKAIELNPNLAIVYNCRGNVYVDKGKYDQAIQDYNKAIELDPENAEFYTNNRKLAEKLKKVYKKIADRY
jgi:tetratricopeptide (TPR) repeat protein